MIFDVNFINNMNNQMQDFEDEMSIVEDNEPEYEIVSDTDSFDIVAEQYENGKTDTPKEEKGQKNQARSTSSEDENKKETTLPFGKKETSKKEDNKKEEKQVETASDQVFNDLGMDAYKNTENKQTPPKTNKSVEEMKKLAEEQKKKEQQKKENNKPKEETPTSTAKTKKEESPKETSKKAENKQSSPTPNKEQEQKAPPQPQKPTQTFIFDMDEEEETEEETKDVEETPTPTAETPKNEDKQSQETVEKETSTPNPQPTTIVNETPRGEETAIGNDSKTIMGLSENPQPNIVRPENELFNNYSTKVPESNEERKTENKGKEESKEKKSLPPTITKALSFVALLVVIILIPLLFSDKDKKTKNTPTTTTVTTEFYLDLNNTEETTIEGSARFNTLEDLTLYISSNQGVILSNEKQAVTKYNNGKLSKEELIATLDANIDASNQLYQLLILNKSAYENEGKIDEYNNLYTNMENVLSYGITEKSKVQ